MERNSIEVFDKSYKILRGGLLNDKENENQKIWSIVISRRQRYGLHLSLFSPTYHPPPENVKKFIDPLPAFSRNQICPTLEKEISTTYSFDE